VPDAVVRHAARGTVPGIWKWFVRRGMAEFEMWRSGLAPAHFRSWMLRTSIMIKLLPFLLLCIWSPWPLLAVLGLMLADSMRCNRWVLELPDIPAGAWFCMSWVKMMMRLASDVGRLRAWLFG